MTTLDAQVDFAVKVAIFVGFQYVALGYRSLLRLLLPSTPLDVQVQGHRQAFIIRKLIDRAPDAVRIDKTTPTMLL